MSRQFLVPVVLPADPANALEAAPKQYVDAVVVEGNGAPSGSVCAPGNYYYDRTGTAPVAGATRVVRFARMNKGTLSLTASNTTLLQFNTQDLIAAHTYQVIVFIRAVQVNPAPQAGTLLLQSNAGGTNVPDCQSWFAAARDYHSETWHFVASGTDLNLGAFRVIGTNQTGGTLNMFCDSNSHVMVSEIAQGTISNGSPS